LLCLQQLREDQALHAVVPDPAPLQEYVESGRPLSNDSFAEWLGENPPDLLKRVLHWSARSNDRIAAQQREPDVFPGVGETITVAREFANTMIVSATPAAALQTEWAHAGLVDMMDAVAGQEVGPKRDQLASAVAAFERDHCLMVGDAPGDHLAARDNGILFFPIVPGAEASSWRELRKGGLARFRAGTFRGEYEERLATAYYRALDSHAG
jgi:phosphoglycolate phosphatase-like HAD superfamily hydrolase